jgi:hypothetical protein
VQPAANRQRRSQLHRQRGPRDPVGTEAPPTQKASAEPPEAAEKSQLHFGRQARCDCQRSHFSEIQKRYGHNNDNRALKMCHDDFCFCPQKTGRGREKTNR